MQRIKTQTRPPAARHRTQARRGLASVGLWVLGLWMMAAGLWGAPEARAQVAPGGAGAGAQLILVELYTAQGCEACRTANTHVAELADAPNVVVLTFPVDHWDYLGWRDTFARPEFAARQRAYATAMGDRSLKTPQVVINGARAASGAASARVTRVIASTPQATGAALRISAAGPERALIEIARGPLRSRPADVWLATVDPRAVAVTPARGENAGQPVLQRNVVLNLQHLGAWTGAARRFDAPCAPACVAIVQDGRGGAVMATAAHGLRPER
jgi:hypothetical protein